MDPNVPSNQIGHLRADSSYSKITETERNKQLNQLNSENSNMRKILTDCNKSTKFYQQMQPLNPVFCVINAIRTVQPYWMYYNTFSKGRWVGRKLVDVFRDEFHLTSDPHYMTVAVKLGRFLVDGIRVNVDFVLKQNQRILHYRHRHESPVLDTPRIEVIKETDDLLIVNKPPSLPVHTSGNYKFLTVLGLLQHLHGYRQSELRVLHRLDRTTSGVLMFAKNYRTDQHLKKLLVEKKWHKEYICKVCGIFPNDKEIICDQPLGALTMSNGIQCVLAEGKKSKTRFRLGWTDGRTSVVHCYPETGRTHQIRVHLQFLGYPIVNDQIYNSDAWGPNKGKNGDYGKTIDQLRTDVKKEFSSERWHVNDVDSEFVDRMEKLARTDQVNQEEIPTNLSEMPDYDPICVSCHVTKKQPSQEHYSMYLHCFKYEVDGETYCTSLPHWAIQPS